jgi:hypothetical protein
MHKVQIVSNAGETSGTFCAIFSHDDGSSVQRYAGWTDRGHGVAGPIRDRFYVEHHVVTENAKGVWRNGEIADLWFEDRAEAMAAWQQAVGAAVLAAEADRHAAVMADTAQIAVALSR